MKGTKNKSSAAHGKICNLLGSNNRNSLLDFDPLSVRRTCAPLMMGRASVWSERKLSLKSFHSTYPWSEWTIILVWNLKSLETSFIFSFIFTHLKLCSFDHWFDELKGILAHSAVLPYLLPLPQILRFRGRGGWPKKFRGRQKIDVFINFYAIFSF